MRIGIQLGMHGHSGRAKHPPPGWQNMLEQVRAAEAAGFDLVVIEDAVTDGGMNTHGYWEAAALAGAVVAVTSTITVGHSMLNPPLRPPAVIASMAMTLDEISNGRYVLGMGAGNTPDDYEAFGIAANHRYSRAAETLEIVHSLLRTGSADYDGRFHRAHGELATRGPSPEGPPIVVGGTGPKMIRLAVRIADGWNAWSPDPQTVDTFRPLIEEADRACEEIGRDPSSLMRSLDVAVDPHAILGEPPSNISPYLVSGSAEDIAAQLLEIGQLGIGEIRMMIWPDRPPAGRPSLVKAMSEVVTAVHHA